MIYFIIAIIIFTIIMTYYVDGISRIFKINGIITIIAGYLIIFLNYILKNTIVKGINLINISKVATIIFKKVVNKGLILILMGTIQLVISVLVYFYKKKNY